MTGYGSRANPTVALERAGRGLNWLKVFGPFLGLDHRRIDPDTILVSDPARCPLAQASPSGRYSVVIDQLTPDRSPRVSTYGQTVNDWITDCGFDVAPWDAVDMYVRLTQAWQKVLRQDQFEREAAA